MSYPSTSSRLPRSSSPKQNQFYEHGRLSTESHGQQRAYDYHCPRAPQNIQGKASKDQQYGPHISPQSTSLLGRIGLPCEKERSLLDRMSLNEGASSKHNSDQLLDSSRGGNTRICGSQTPVMTFPGSPNQKKASRYRRTQPLTAITQDFPPRNPVKTEESDNTLLSSSFEDGVIKLLTTGSDLLREPLSGSTTSNSSHSASVIEKCRKQLAPVLLMSAKLRDSPTNLDIKKCAAMLTDNHCYEFLQRAREMKLQMDALAPHSQDNSPVDEHIGRDALKRRRGEEDRNGHTRTTRVRLDSRGDSSPAISRKDSEVTLVDSPIDCKVPTFIRDNMRQDTVIHDIAPSHKNIMEHGHNHSSTDVHISNITSAPHQTAALSSAAVEMITCHSPDSRTTPTADSQNLTTCSSTDCRAPSPSVTSMKVGIWFKRQGLTRPGILDIEFAMEEHTIPATFSSGIFDPQSTVQLACFLKDASHDVQEWNSLNSILENIQNQNWPARGSLVVQLNIENPNGRSWLPYQLEQGSQNVTSSLVPGKNVMRLIHLGNLSDFIFVLYALPGEPLKPEECWRQGGWTSKVSRPDIPPETTSIISKYASIPTTP